MSSSTSLIDKIFNHMLSNEQCEKYLKFLLKNPLISMIKTKPNLEIDPTKYKLNKILKKINKILKKKLKKLNLLQNLCKVDEPTKN